MTTADQAKGQHVQTTQRPRRRSRLGALFSRSLKFDGRAPQRLLIAPHDLRTADPTIANDIYRGRLSLAGAVADIGTTSPFVLPPPSQAWQEELLSFAWLRHLHAADDPVSKIHARALIGDWIAIQGKGHPVAWKPEVTARRIISWLSHSPLYLEKVDPAYYQAVMKSLGRQLKHLSRHVSDAEDGLPRLTAYIALAYSTLCISGFEKMQGRVGRHLAQELSRQVLPDGGHISRDPRAILELLLDLLPLRQTFLSRDIIPTPEFISAIDRMLPMVRFFRHGDGDFALFNGMGRTPIGAVSSVLAYDDTLGRHSEQAPHSGYQRLEAGNTIVFVDTGAAPPTPVSNKAHAGCLSFEVSTGQFRIIGNCGTSSALRENWRRAARLTAAHSTVTIENTSSVKFAGPKRGDFRLDAAIVSGPKSVKVSRQDNEDGKIVEARHDGYKSLGILHTRRIKLSEDGLEIDGQDKLTRSSTFLSRPRAYTIRFHIHPSVDAQIDRDGRTVALTLPNDEHWLFTAIGATPRLDDSVFLADPKGALGANQIVIAGQCGSEAVVKWRLYRDTGHGVRRVRRLKAGEREDAVMPATAGPLAGENEISNDVVEETQKDSPPKPATPDLEEKPASTGPTKPAPGVKDPEPKKSPVITRGPGTPPSPKPPSGAHIPAARPAAPATGTPTATPQETPPRPAKNASTPVKSEPSAAKAPATPPARTTAPADTPAQSRRRTSGLGLGPAPATTRAGIRPKRPPITAPAKTSAADGGDDNRPRPPRRTTPGGPVKPGAVAPLRRSLATPVARPGRPERAAPSSDRPDTAKPAEKPASPAAKPLGESRPGEVPKSPPPGFSSVRPGDDKDDG